MVRLSSGPCHAKSRWQTRMTRDSSHRRKSRRGDHICASDGPPVYKSRPHGALDEPAYDLHLRAANPPAWPPSRQCQPKEGREPTSLVKTPLLCEALDDFQTVKALLSVWRSEPTCGFPSADIPHDPQRLAKCGSFGQIGRAPTLLDARAGHPEVSIRNAAITKVPYARPITAVLVRTPAHARRNRACRAT